MTGGDVFAFYTVLKSAVSHGKRIADPPQHEIRLKRYLRRRLSLAAPQIQIVYLARSAANGFEFEPVINAFRTTDKFRHSQAVADKSARLQFVQAQISPADKQIKPFGRGVFGGIVMPESYFVFAGILRKGKSAAVFRHHKTATHIGDNVGIRERGRRGYDIISRSVKISEAAFQFLFGFFNMFAHGFFIDRNTFRQNDILRRVCCAVCRFGAENAAIFAYVHNMHQTRLFHIARPRSVQQTLLFLFKIFVCRTCDYI